MGAVGGLREGDLAGLRSFGAVAGERPDAQARQAVLALAGDEEVGEEVNVLEHHAVAMGNAFGPVLPSQGSNRRRHQPKIPASIIGADEPQAVAMVDGVFVLVFARSDDREHAGGIACVEERGFAGDVAGRLKDDIFAVAGAAGADVEALVVVLVDEHVGGVVRSERVAIELELALLLFVFDGVEHRLVIGGPYDGTGAFHRSRQGFAGLEILDVQRVLSEAGGVCGVGEPAAIVGDVGVADGEEGVAFGHLVAVEYDFFGGVGGRLGFIGTRLRRRLRQEMAYCRLSSVRA